MYCREKCRGGTCIYIRSGIKYRDLDFISPYARDKIFECCGVEIVDLKIIVICVYRTPQSNVTLFLKYLDTLLYKLRFSSKLNRYKIVVVGDININTLKDNKVVQELNDILQCYNLIPHILEATRRNACIDHIFSNIKSATSRVLKLGLSDHDTAQILSMTINKDIYQPSKLYMTKRDFSQENIDKFYECLNSLSFNDMFNETDLNTSFNYFYDNFCLFYELCFPKFKKICMTKRRNIKWITKGLRRSCKTKRTLRFKFYERKNQESRLKYYKYSKLLRRCIDGSQKIYNDTFIANSKNMCRAAWKVINDETKHEIKIDFLKQIRVANKMVTDPQEIANHLNNYFIELTNQACNATPYNGIIKNTNSKHINNSIFLEPVNPVEVRAIIMSLKNTQSVGNDSITTKIIKHCVDLLIPHFTYLINLSFEQGKFPECLKKSVIKPIHKKGDVIDMSNYRPITLIPIFSKVFEKAMQKRLVNYLNKYELIKSEQYGFQKGKSTTLAAFHLVNNILTSIDKGIAATVIFFDMSKAFDFVSHDILIQKMENYGIRGPAMEWSKSYLQNRQQYVEISCLQGNVVTQCKSNSLINKYGVPQGSILGPLYFLIYINDLPDITPYKCILFADDISLIITHKTKNCTNNYIETNMAIKDVIQWLEYNNLKANINKTTFIKFKTQGHKTEPTVLHDDRFSINESTYTRFLGLTVDQHCNWKKHIEAVSKKVNSFVYVLNKLRTTSTPHTLQMAYHGHVGAILRYCLILWGNSTDSFRAFLAQKRCIRAMAGIPSYESCRPYFKKFKILPLPSMYIFEICLFVKKNSTLFLTAHEYYPRNTRHGDRLVLDFTPRTTLYQRNCFSMCINIYNRLPKTIRELPLSRFKRDLKNLLLNKMIYAISDWMHTK